MTLCSFDRKDIQYVELHTSNPRRVLFGRPRRTGLTWSDLWKIRPVKQKLKKTSAFNVADLLAWGLGRAYRGKQVRAQVVKQKLNKDIIITYCYLLVCGLQLQLRG